MKTYISILRGINVSGQKLIKMDALREMFSGLGLHNVQTYIQSGNVLFKSKQTDEEKLARKIEKEISKKFGLEVPVMVKEINELKEIIHKNPFLKDASKDISLIHVTFLSAIPAGENFDKIKSIQSQQDEFQLGGKSIYLYCPNGYGNTKLNNNFFESKLKATATTRNWRTLNELIKMAEKL
ncbi:MAG: DUF1697 domain-containing protein [Chitinophagaceae bacterium]